MTNATHTPGPWRVFSTPLGVGATAADADVAHCDGFHTSRSRQEEEANARLIAAAPDLLAALEAVRFNLRRAGYEENSIMIEGIDTALRLANPASTNEEAV